MNLRDIFLAGAFAQGGGAVSPEQIDQAVNDYLEKNPVGVDLAMTGATVGQIAKITAVDASGIPTAWEPVDLPSGKYEHIVTFDLASLSSWTTDVLDVSGYKAIAAFVSLPSTSVNVIVNGSVYWGPEGSSSGVVRIFNEGRIVVGRSFHKTTNANAAPAWSIFQPPAVENAWDSMEEEMETLLFRTGSNLTNFTTGKIEVYGVRK